jgi:hypothetical protein
MSTTDVHSDITAVRQNPLRETYLAELRHILCCLSVADVLAEVARHATVKASRFYGSPDGAWATAHKAWVAAAEDIGNVAQDLRDKGI